MAHLSPELIVDLTALTENYRLLSKRFTGKATGAVVKANAYGLGVEPVSRALQQAGCDIFFVATLEEAIELRQSLPDITIAVFHGAYKDEEAEYRTHRIVPVLNTPDAVKRWAETAQGDPDLPSMLHVDTGISRLGLTSQQAETLAKDQALQQQASLTYLMSHLSCGDDATDPLNLLQQQRFSDVCKLFPALTPSLCNSAGIFLDASFHVGIARPGCALYGINPLLNQSCPVKPVVTLQAPVMQIREAQKGDAVGYGATYQVDRLMKLATVQIGYADGYQRMLSNKAVGYVGGKPCPLVGRVSMDMIIFDVSDVSDKVLGDTQMVVLLNQEYTVNHMARDAQTIGYEILTCIGRRVRRQYKK